MNFSPGPCWESCRRARPTLSTAAMASAAARLLRTYAIQVSFLLRADEVIRGLPRGASWNCGLPLG